MNNTGIVRSDQTMLAVVQSLHEMGETGVTELADHLDLSKGAVHKHLKTLEQQNFVINTNGRYKLGLKVFTYGARVKERKELSQLLEKKVDKLVKRTNEMIVASVEESGKGIFIQIRNDPYDLSRVSSLGRRYNLNVCASGKAMLAQMPNSKVREIIEQHGLAKQTDNTITSEEALFEELDKIRKNNYAINAEELREGMGAIGGAVYHPQSETFGALAISVPSHRISNEEIRQEYIDALLEAINELEIKINYG